MSKGLKMESEIQEQPDVLARNCDKYWDYLRTALAETNPGLVLLVARGSSDNAAMYARYLIEISLGVPVSLCAPSVWTAYGRQVNCQNCLVIGISQSGAAPDVAEVLSQTRAQGAVTLALTNVEGSRVSRSAEHTLFLDAGGECSVAATKTYTASLLALYQVVRALGNSGLPDPRASMPNHAWSAECRQRAESLAGSIVEHDRWFVVSRGLGFATANETALKMMECALLPFKSFSFADFQHGPMALAGEGSFILEFAPTGPDEESERALELGPYVLQKLLDHGATIARAPESHRSCMAPIWDAFFSQWLALQTARLRGLDPDSPPAIQKVTRTL